MSTSGIYRGRFAPSPTGPLHIGSLIAAVGSYLDAKHHQGLWLLRMEDVDTPRTAVGAADHILRTLENFGLHWDEQVIYQSQRTAAYEDALHDLRRINAVYPCACTRKEIADSAVHGIDGQIYPGTCRNGTMGRAGRAWRVRTDNNPIQFDDSLQGRISQQLESEIGDFVVKRADGLFAYQLAVVVDDAYQQISHVVRGADLIHSTSRQIHLQHLLGLPSLQYLHLPLMLNSAGEKLSKQTLAPAIDHTQAPALLLQALKFLRQTPPAELAYEDVPAILQWAIKNWDRNALAGVKNITSET